MRSNKVSYQLLAQAETLLIYGIFLFLTGLAQIAVTISHRYLIERTLHFSHLFPLRWTTTEIHQWYIYPSAGLVSQLHRFFFVLFQVTLNLFFRQLEVIFFQLRSPSSAFRHEMSCLTLSPSF